MLGYFYRKCGLQLILLDISTNLIASLKYVFCFCMLKYYGYHQLFLY